MNRDRPPRHIGDHQIDTVVAGLLADAKAACARWLTIQQRSSDWARHYPAGGTEPVGGSHVADAMAELVAAELDDRRPVIDPGAVAIRWLWEMKEIGERLQRLREQAEDMVPKQPEISRESTIGKCECCERAVARNTNDPLKGGLCRKCYEAWQRAKRNGTDRATFMARRRMMLGADIEATG